MTTRASVSVAAARRKATGLLRQEGNVAPVTPDTSPFLENVKEEVGALGDGRPVETPSAQPLVTESGAERARNGLESLLYDALVKGQREARRAERRRDAAPRSNPKLVAAIEKALLREKAKRTLAPCRGCGALTTGSFCTRCIIPNRC